MAVIDTLILVIVALPLAATLATAAIPRGAGRMAHWPLVVAMTGMLIATAWLFGAMTIDAKRIDAEHAAAEHTMLIPHGESTDKDHPSHIAYERIVPLWTWVDIATPAFRPADQPADGIDATATSSQTRGHWAITPERGGARLLSIDVSLRVDPLSSIMLLMLSTIGLAVAVYSIGYMHGEPEYKRFYIFLGLFSFSMAMLVSASNFVLLYVFWEGVGLCSYLLIGFWHKKPEAAAASKKAFLVNRVGDFALVIAIFLIWTLYGTLNFHDTALPDGTTVAGVLGQTRLTDPSLLAHGSVATLVCVLLFAGACGKSAQAPLHIWLPDAMAGPTPASALIYGATMVTAGVYLVARCIPLFVASPTAQAVVAGVGGATALIAAVAALTEKDLKRVLAWSTVSQLGYMFLALGAATLLGVTAALFHLVVHTFFKALLFLGAGNVMHGTGGNTDLDYLGGLAKKMPITRWTMLIGFLTLAAVFPLSAFWSKDVILIALDERANAVGPFASLYGLLFWAALVTAAMTAFYAIRAHMRTFHGKDRSGAWPGRNHRQIVPHESPLVMTLPLIVLAVLPVGVGAGLEWTHVFSHFLEASGSIVHFQYVEKFVVRETLSHLIIAGLGTLASVGGIALAWVLYRGEAKPAERLTGAMRRVGLYQISRQAFFIDWLLQTVIGGILAGIAMICGVFDRQAVDGLVDGVALFFLRLGRMLRPVQNGLLPFYALAMTVGVLVLIGILFW